MSLTVIADLNQEVSCRQLQVLTHWGRVTHICVSDLTIIGSDNGLSPDRRQAIIWTNAGILSIGPLAQWNKAQWNINRNSYIFIQENASENVVGKWRRSCIGLNVLRCLPISVTWKIDNKVDFRNDYWILIHMKARSIYNYNKQKCKVNDKLSKR